MEHYVRHPRANSNQGNMMMMHEHQNGHEVGMPVMTMYFHLGIGDRLLLKNWILDSYSKFTIACILIAILGLCLEFIKFLRARCNCSSNQSCQTGSEDNNSLNRRQGMKRRLLIRFIPVLLHILQLTLSYILMLIAMTYNVWLILSIIFGKYFDTANICLMLYVY